MPRRAPLQSKSRGGTEFASAKQTIRLTDDAVNLVYDLQDVNLAQYDRLVNIARNYQFFRITKIEYKFMPYRDTYVSSVGQSVPYLHWLMNKSGALDANTFNGLRDAGAKPIRFDEKTITVSWKPTVLTAVAANQPINAPPTGVSFAQYKTSPWLATNENPSSGALTWLPSTVPHKGMLYGVQQSEVSGQQYFGTEITVYVQFKKPMVFTNSTAAPTTVKQIVAAPEETGNPLG